MHTLKSAVTPLQIQHSRPNETSLEAFVTHGSYFGRTTPHRNPDEDRLRRPFEYPRIMVLGAICLSSSRILVILNKPDGEINHQLAVLILLKELMLVVAEHESREDDKVESSSASPMARQSCVEDGFRLCHYFDYICGMNGAGISAVLLGRLRFEVDDALTTVQQILDEQSRACASLSGSRCLKGFYESASRSKADVQAKKDLSAQWMMGKIDGDLEFESPFGLCRTLVTTSRNDATHTNAPYVLRSYEILDPEDRGLRNPDEPTHFVRLFDVFHATLAPSSRPWKIDIPGMIGLYHDASSKDYDAQDEVEKEIAALHLGSTEHFAYKLSNKIRLSSYPERRPWFNVDVASNVPEESLGDICLDGSPLSLPGLPRMSKNGCSERVQTVMQEYCATGYVQEILSHWAEKMVAERKHRAGFDRWETFAFGVHYKCCICEDTGRNSGFMDVDRWSSHVTDEHKTPPFAVEERCRVIS